MNTSTFQQEQQALEARIRQAREKIASFREEMGGIDGELQGLFGERQKFELLSQVCVSLEKLESIGASHLFWGEHPPAIDTTSLIGKARVQADEFLGKINGLEQRRQNLDNSVEDELFNIDSWKQELAELAEQEERRQWEFVVDRDISKLPFRAMVMPWDPQGEDQKRFRKAVLISLLLSLLIGGGASVWELPPDDQYAPPEIPKNLVQLVKEKKEPPKKKEIRKEEKKEEEKKKEEPKPEETQVTKTTTKATPKEVAEARTKAKSTGIFAGGSLSNMLADTSMPQLGANAVGGSNLNAGAKADGLANQRAIVASASGGSGGINVASLSRDLGGGGGGGAGKLGGGVGPGKVSSGIAAVAAKQAKAAGGAGKGSRSDQDIQIVFDKYKSRLYRMYQRELRNDPTLQGKLILSLTIEPDGSVSVCNVKSTSLNSPSLVADLVAQVKRMNFGPAEGGKMTITFPIDFFPAG